jgi:hypothetical protein
LYRQAQNAATIYEVTSLDHSATLLLNSLPLLLLLLPLLV